MNLLKDDDLSSIALESANQSISESQINLLTKELSSLSWISQNDSENNSIQSEHSNPELQNLKSKLKENVNTLNQELKTYEESSKKESNSRRETSFPEEIIDQLHGIKSKIEDLKIKLRNSEEMIENKVKENFQLKEELKSLEIKNFTSNDKCVACQNCIIY